MSDADLLNWSPTAAGSAAVAVDGGTMRSNNPNILAQCHFAPVLTVRVKSPSHDGGQQQENSGGFGQRAACSGEQQQQVGSGGNEEGKSRSGSRTE
jgi:hypothetical protein